jgi:hypothetical protein
MRRLAFLLACAPLAGAQVLVNPGFEEPGSAPPGWKLAHGAGDPAGAPSRAACDDATACEGRRSLRLAGDAGTRSWQYVSQRLEARPGHRWTLRAALKSADVRREAGQFENSYVRLAFYDAGGALIQQEVASLQGTRDWCETVLTAGAPEAATAAEVGLFLSLSGTLWIDDLRLDVSPTAPFSDTGVRAAAFDALAGHLRRTYPFFGLPGKPLPDELFAAYRPRALREQKLKGFAGVLKRMLDELDDLHVHLLLDGERISTGPRGSPHPANWNLEAVEAHAAEVLSRGDNHLVARLKQGVGYVRLASFGAEWEELKAADQAMDQLADVKGWILDVRPNGGGAEDKGELFAARFTGKSLEYARHVFRDPFAPDDPSAFTPVRSRWLTPRKDRAADARPVAVLMGPYCVSSTEGFLMMMQALPTATLVGLPSRGASANPATFAVVPGLELVSSRWRSLTLDERCIEGTGVEPDVVVDEGPEGYRTSDPTFERALVLFQ